MNNNGEQTDAKCIFGQHVKKRRSKSPRCKPVTIRKITTKRKIVQNAPNVEVQVAKDEKKTTKELKPKKEWPKKPWVEEVLKINRAIDKAAENGEFFDKPASHVLPDNNNAPEAKMLKMDRKPEFGAIEQLPTNSGLIVRIDERTPVMEISPSISRDPESSEKPKIPEKSEKINDVRVKSDEKKTTNDLNPKREWPRSTTNVWACETSPIKDVIAKPSQNDECLDNPASHVQHNNTNSPIPKIPKIDKDPEAIDQLNKKSGLVEQQTPLRKELISGLRCSPISSTSASPEEPKNPEKSEKIDDVRVKSHEKKTTNYLKPNTEWPRSRTNVWVCETATTSRVQHNNNNINSPVPKIPKRAEEPEASDQLDKKSELVELQTPLRKEQKSGLRCSPVSSTSASPASPAEPTKPEKSEKIDNEDKPSLFGGKNMKLREALLNNQRKLDKLKLAAEKETRRFVYLPTAFLDGMINESSIKNLYPFFNPSFVRIHYTKEMKRTGSGTFVVGISQEEKVVQWAKNMEWRAQKLRTIPFLSTTSDKNRILDLLVSEVSIDEEISEEAIIKHLQQKYQATDIMLFYQENGTFFGTLRMKVAHQNCVEMLRNFKKRGFQPAFTTPETKVLEILS